jgi:hypothetical protein
MGGPYRCSKVLLLTSSTLIFVVLGQNPDADRESYAIPPVCQDIGDGVSMCYGFCSAGNKDALGPCGDRRWGHGQCHDQAAVPCPPTSCEVALVACAGAVWPVGYDGSVNRDVLTAGTGIGGGDRHSVPHNYTASENAARRGKGRLVFVSLIGASMAAAALVAVATLRAVFPSCRSRLRIRFRTGDRAYNPTDHARPVLPDHRP